MNNQILIAPYNPERPYKPPVKGSDGAAAYDIHYTGAAPELIAPKETKLLTTNIKMVIPANTVGIIKDRSSMAKKGIHVHGGVIDSDYRGEVRVLMYNASDHVFVIHPEVRIAQILFVRLSDAPVSLVPVITDETTRGEGGFGSTGE